MPTRKSLPSAKVGGKEKKSRVLLYIDEGLYSDFRVCAVYDGKDYSTATEDLIRQYVLDIKARMKEEWL